MSPQPPFPVLIHPYPSSSSPPDRPFLAYEHLPPNPLPPSGKRKNILLFLPGLGEGPLDIPYTRTLAPYLAEINYSLFETRLSSSYSAFGYSSLAQDAEEIAALVRHLRAEVVENGGKVVLMGHSTGCQDCVAYAHRHEGVDGLVLQGAVSDREAIGMDAEDDGGKGVRWALEVGGKGEGVMVPREMLPGGWRGQPVSAYRWWGDDDFFSSDLGEEEVKRIWGGLKRPVLILLSGEDEWVPKGVDVEGLLTTWMAACGEGIASEESGLIPKANHRVDGEEAQKWMAERVVRFLKGLER
ncbi:hypothetical protein B0T18DRAFT_333945 [Schizothecium vesticola]|uniref:DUF1749-domain-containing protein n=1 Tax=Schizothecium vesticola TaxID=314040 RepID=A0AA40EGZ9_9PEZI|nr:hypothetical protein B0T18DRAFT_333945 [Schizothecium vesticola]